MRICSRCASPGLRYSSPSMQRTSSDCVEHALYNVQHRRQPAQHSVARCSPNSHACAKCLVAKGHGRPLDHSPHPSSCTGRYAATPRLSAICLLRLYVGRTWRPVLPTHAHAPACQTAQSLRGGGSELICGPARTVPRSIARCSLSGR